MAKAEDNALGGSVWRRLPLLKLPEEAAGELLEGSRSSLLDC